MQAIDIGDVKYPIPQFFSFLTLSLFPLTFFDQWFFFFFFSFFFNLSVLMMMVKYKSKGKKVERLGKAAYPDSMYGLPLFVMSRPWHFIFSILY